jgi:hypothetical protein
MAVTTAKVTYSLKPETVDRVQELSIQWGVPKSEVIRRAVEKFSSETPVKKPRTPMEAFLWLQKNGISAAAAKKWKAEVRRERHAWGQKDSSRRQLSDRSGKRAVSD